jgi:hypothetical protein
MSLFTLREFETVAASGHLRCFQDIGSPVVIASARYGSGINVTTPQIFVD